MSGYEYREHPYWNIDNVVGGYDCPVNIEDILNAANGLIDDMFNSGAEYEEIEEFSHALYYQFCETGKVGSVTAIYE